MNSDKRHNSEKDRLRALLSLSSPHKTEKSACPSDMDLALLLEGKLKSEEQQAIHSHLDNCATCYHEWLVASTLLPKADPEIRENNTTSRETNHQKKIIDFKTFIKKKQITISVGFAIAASILIIFMLPFFYSSSQVSSLVRKQFEIAQKGRFYSPQMVPVSPSEKDKEQFFDSYRLGFSYDVETGIGAAKGFFRGVDAGMERIKDDQFRDSLEDLETKWHDYFWIGQWYVLMGTLCGSQQEIPTVFWDRQSETAKALHQIFRLRAEEEKEASIITQSLGRIQLIIDTRKDIPVRLCHELTQETRLLFEIIASG